jgi:rfaE bifunctional protein kinase chain/domain
MKLTELEINTLFERVRESHFVVVGDFCLDAYFFLDDAFAEISTETGLKTRSVESMRFSPGGAGNVAANLTAMGAEHVYGLGVVGDDLYGREILGLLSSAGVDTGHMVTQQDRWYTNVYTKLYDRGRELPRIDIGNTNRLHPQSAKRLLEGLTQVLPAADVVLINQQLNNGIHTEAFRQDVKKIVQSYRDKIFLLDSRQLVDEYGGTFRKLNEKEAASAAGLDPAAIDCGHIDNVSCTAEVLYRRWGTPVFITRGERGSLVHDSAGLHVIPGLHILAPKDTVGAGDSIFAGLAAGLSAGFSNEKALLFATFMAGVTVQKRFQTGTASQEKIRELAKSPEFRHNPEKAESLETATYWQDSEIEILHMPPPKKRAYVIFDHDGTISTLREGWESIMEPLMIKAILGEVAPRASEALRNSVTETVRKYIDETTGVPTLVQMTQLEKMVRETGIVTADRILDPEEYKRLYLNELNRLVEARLHKLGLTEMDACDFTIKGAIPFLKTLRGKGMTLFLTSGTDDDGLRKDAGCLGYVDLFNGGIFGATGSVRNETKKAVIEMILSKIGRDKCEQIVTFGDGPVEMRATWRVGEFAWVWPAMRRSVFI